MQQKLKVTLGSDQILGVDEAQRGRLSNLRGHQQPPFGKTSGGGHAVMGGLGPR